MSGVIPIRPHGAPFWLKAVGIIAGVVALWAAMAVVLVLAISFNGRGVTVNAAWWAGAPVVLALAAIQSYCLIDLLRPERHVKGRSKGAWAVAILASISLGCVAYLTNGREDF